MHKKAEKSDASHHHFVGWYMSKIETERLAVIFFKEEMQGNLCCCLSVMGLGGSPRHPLALGQSGFLWPWPLLVSYPIYKLIHSLTWLLLHWCFSRHWREGNIISLVFVLLPTTLLLTLFSVTALCFPLFPAFLDSALPFHIPSAHFPFPYSQPSPFLFSNCLMNSIRFLYYFTFFSR